MQQVAERARQSDLPSISWLVKLSAEACSVTVSQSCGWDLEGPKLSGPSSNELMFLLSLLFICAVYIIGAAM